MEMGRKAFLASAAVGVSGFLSGCESILGGGGAGERTQPVAGPATWEDALDKAELAAPPDGATPEMSEPEAPEGYDWVREVSFSAPADAVDEWIVDSYGSAEAVPRAYAVSDQVKTAFGVDEVPSTWRCATGMVSGTPLQLFVLVDDADPAAVRVHLRRMAD